MLVIRPATEADQEAILDIYNEVVLNNTATFDTDPRTLEKQMEWFRNHKKNHPVLVGEKEGQVIAWASLSPWSDRCAYDTTVEVSVYVNKDYRKQGIGTQLLKQVTILGKSVGNHTVLSRITQGNEQSIHIHEKLGYRHVGTMKEVGYKFGNFLDVHMMQIVY
jgi:L-amino acid N-acyltransferase